MALQTEPSSLTVSLVSGDPAWIECLEQAAAVAGLQPTVAPSGCFTAWPPQARERSRLYLVDADAIDPQALDPEASPGAGEPALVWLGADQAVARVPQALREAALGRLETVPTPQRLAEELKLWRELLDLRRANKAVQKELDGQNIQVELLGGKLKRLEEWVDLLNRQRSSMGNVMEKFNMLSRLGQQINTLDVDQIARICVEKIPLLVDAKFASLYMYDPGADELVLTRHNHTADLPERIRLADATGSLMAAAIERKEVLVIKHVDELERQHGINAERPHQDRYRTGTCIVAPLVSADRVVGVLNLTGKTTGEFFDELNDLPAVEHLSHLLAAAIRNCQLFQEVETQARSDAMTGFLNHRTFLEELAGELARAERYGNEPSVIMLDCDKFKAINDTYGHQAGDHVIREIAEVIRTSIRDVDKPCRYGGDEFAIILVNSDIKVAREVADRILRRCRTHQMAYGEMSTFITLSIGVCHASEGCDVNSLVRAADEALYQAKEGGRNQVAVHQQQGAVA